MTALVGPGVQAAMQSGLPSTIVSCSKEGVPNTTFISQIYYVDDSHVALSFQFFNKTIRNVRENPYVCASLTDLMLGCHWKMMLKYVRSETEGRTFDEMEMQLEAIASATGMSGIFKLKAADIYQVSSVEQLVTPTWAARTQ